jgi:CheY-like chemotaxis protein
MRNLLIIHESQTVRELLKRYIFSELNDTYVSDAASSEVAVQKLQSRKFDVVICGNKMAGIDGPRLYKKTRDFFQANRETPFIILLQKKAGENLDELNRQGVEHVLVSPFTAEEFRAKIDHVCNPRNLRVHDRISIPDTKAVVRWEGSEVEAKMVNISVDGILCDVACSGNYGELLKGAYISLSFPPQYSNVQINNLFCKVLRLGVLAHDANHLPTNLRVVWQFVAVMPLERKALEQVIEKARKDCEQLKKEHS